MENYKILTDATSDFTPQFAKQAGVELIPMEFDMDGKTYTFGADDDFSYDSFYKAMREGSLAHTSQINIEVYRKYFEKYLSQGQDIIYICFSSSLSGTIQAAKMCIEELKVKYPQQKMYCVDSFCASGGQGLLVYTAAQKKKEGWGIDALAKWAKNYCKKVCLWFTVEDLEHLHRGGRVSKTVAVMGTALNIKPVMHMDDAGKLTNVDKVRGRINSIEALLKKYEATHDENLDSTVFISHADCLEDAEYLKSKILEITPDAPVFIANMGPIIGTHTGSGCLSMYFWGTKR